MSVVKKLITSYKNQIHKTKAAPYLFLVSLVLIFYFPAVAGMAADPAPLKEITVVLDDNYPPYIFRDENGNIQGILVDEWGLWEKKTGIKVDLQGMDWEKAKKAMAAGNAQVIDTIFFTEERAKTLAFSAPYASLDVPIFFHKDISGIKDVKSLHGFTIGVKAGDACIDYLKRDGIHTLREYPSYESIVRDAAEQKIKVFCIDAPPARYFLYKLNLEQQYRHTAPLYTGQFHRAVHKERTDLLKTVEEGFAKISRKEHEEIEKRWRGSSIARPYLIYLSYLIGGLLILGAILLLWNQTLRRRVAQKTVQLQEAINDLKKSEDKYRLVVENAEEAILIAQDGLLKYFNPITITMLGYSEEVLTSMPFVEIIHPEDREKLLEAHIRIMKGEESRPVYQFRVLPSDGTVRWADSRAVTISWEGKPATLNFITDITERKRAEDELRRMNAFLDSVVENIPNMIFLKDAVNLRFVRFNRAGEDLLGYSRNDLLGKNDYDFFPKDQADFFTKKDREVLHGKEVVDIPEEPLQTRNKGERTMHTKKVPILDVNGEPEYLLGIAEDITEQKRAEEALRSSEALYRTLFERSADGIIFGDSKTAAIRYANPAMCRMLGYSGAEITLLNLMDIHPKDALPEVIAEFQAHAHGEKSASHDLPCLRKDGTVFYADVQVGLNLVNGVMCNVGFFHDITERKQAEKERQEGFDQLRKALGATVRAIASMVEARDPYTAGHQRRVADLARTIATEMGLESGQIEGLRIAGMIHDIGKIVVPAEILSKPTRLTEIEFSLIKNHVQAGYDILKDIEFPWHVARMVLEHHEKMNGSGYPQGLPGDKLLIESRIIAVADVVEAMASHRPYRPGLGIDKALDEISKNRGVLYDQEVVDVCLRLFNEKGYKLEG